AFVYIPISNANGTDTFTYKTNDGLLDSNIATVTITINPVNDAPVALNDDYTMNANTTLTVGPAGVLSNDVDVEGDPLTAILVSGPVHGSLTLNADGSFTYTPNSGFTGTEFFTYKANDGTTDGNIAAVSITVNSTDSAPVAANDSYTTNEDTVLSVAATGILGNDTDANGDTLSAVLVAGPTLGSLTLNSDGS